MKRTGLRRPSMFQADEWVSIVRGAMARPLIPTDAEVEARLRQWSEATALSLALLEAAIRREHPGLSEAELRDRLIERLDTFRRLRV